MSEAPPNKRGRPPLPPDQRKGSTPVRTIRLDAQRWAKLRALGRAWLEKAIDAAS